jgi:hypothetical protein
MVVALFSANHILMIKEPTKRLPHYYKLLSETFEPNEAALNALWGAIREEAGLELEVKRNDLGEVDEITDKRVSVYKQVFEPEWIETRRPHWRHFWAVMTMDEVILSLDDKRLNPEPDEVLLTLARPFSTHLLTDEETLQPHRELLRRLIASLTNAK